MVRRGQVLINPASGERAVVREGTDENGGQRLVVDLHLRPGGGMTGRHYHPSIHEKFTVLGGTIRFTLNGTERIAAVGETVDIAPGAVHDFWNVGESEAVARVEVEPAARFVELIQNGFWTGPGWQNRCQGTTEPVTDLTPCPGVCRCDPLCAASACRPAHPFHSAGSAGQAVGLPRQLSRIPGTRRAHGKH